jgi:hypothetical protein
LDKKYILSKILQMKTLTKKEKMMKRMLMTIAVLVMISSLLMAQGYSGGDGSEGNPYQIANEADLIYLSKTSGDWDKHFKQTASISFNADESKVDWDGDGSLEHPGDDAAGWSPIGNSTTNFTGDYNGQNFTINNLYINRTATEYVGLFGYVYGSVIQNIGLNDVNITGNAHTGGLLGYSSNSSTITNCFSTGSVSGSGNYVGGLIGESGSSTMNNSYSTSTVTGVQRIGGLIGESTSSTIEKSYSTGSVSGENMMGGFVGFNDGSSSLSNCYSLGNVTRTSKSGLANGGFVGQFYSGTITNCYSKGSVTYDGSVVNNEGFAGWVSGAEGSTQTFSNCFWDEETSGSSSSDGEGAELVGETTANMKTLATFTGVGWDFTDIWAMSSSISFGGYPTLKWTGGYAEAPTSNQIASLANLVYVAENSSRWSASYTQTSDINMWTTPSWDDGKGWTPIGNSTNQFTGSYDGGENAVINLYINRTTGDYQGLFGHVKKSTTDLTIANLSVNDASITAKAYLGVLAGKMDGGVTVSNCSSSGTINSTSQAAGGLIGLIDYVTISNSFSSVNVNSEYERVGGLVGTSWGASTTRSVIEKCYATGNVQGSNSVGGLIGISDYSTISNCYATGDVSRIATANSANVAFASFLGDEGSSVARSTIDKSYATGSVYYAGAAAPTNKGFAGRSDVGNANTAYTNNFFDNQASNQSSATGATAKTTAEMKNSSTTNNIYLLAGWDFKGESANGSDEIWNIGNDRNDGYPYLNWQYSLDDASLPVTLVSFTGKAIKAGVVLEWETSAEIENAGFVIRRQEAGGRNQEEDNYELPITNYDNDPNTLADHGTGLPLLESLSRDFGRVGGSLIASYLTDNSLVGAGSVTKSTHYSFTDSKVEAGKTYVYTLSDVDFSGKETVLAEAKVQVKVKGAIIADNYQLMPVYPNPFNASFTVPFFLNEAMTVKVSLYNIQGQQVMTILQNELNAGDYAYQVNAENLSSGVYFVNVELSGTSAPLSDRKSHTQKIVLMK